MRIQRKPNAYPLKKLLLTFLSFCCLYVSADPSKKIIELSPDLEEVLIDTSYIVEFDSVQGKPATVLTVHKRLFFNQDPSKNLWAKFKVHNNSDTSISWILLSHFYSIDELDIWVKRKRGTEFLFFRDTMSIYNRLIQHKHPTFNIYLEKDETIELLFRIKNESAFEYPFVFMTHESFYSKFFKEYLLYGLFYGFLLFVLVSCIINFIFFRDSVLLIYIFCILSQITYMLFRDGNGLYVVPSATEYADLIKNLSRSAMSISLLLYTGIFLKIDRKSWMFKIILLIVVLRTIYSIVLLEDTTVNTFHFEFFIIVFCTWLAFRFYSSVDSEARYMAMGLSFLSAVYAVHYVSIIGWFPSGAYAFWSLYLGIAGENIFFALALTERFKRARLDKFRQEQMNRELELLVEQRTETVQMQNRLLEAQSNELNLFLYSASHDLKGPLKTIEGLCNVGLLDVSVNHDQLFEMIKMKLRKLESNIGDLNSVTKLKYSNPVSDQNIDLKLLHQDIMDRFEKYPGFESMAFELNIDYKESVRFDTFTIRSIYQNIVENAIKYRDRSKEHSFLTISIYKEGNLLLIEFEDNGQGIPADKTEKIFEMFYRGNEESREDTGLGLYIVKLAVEKLGGKITVQSELGVGTTFLVRIPI